MDSVNEHREVHDQHDLHYYFYKELLERLHSLEINGATKSELNEYLDDLRKDLEAKLATKVNTSTFVAFRTEITNLANSKVSQQEFDATISEIENELDKKLNKSEFENRISNYYTKAETTHTLGAVVDQVNEQLNNIKNTKADKDDVYTKTQTNDLLNTKANTDMVNNVYNEVLANKQTLTDNQNYTNSELQNIINTLNIKADKDDIYTKEQTDTAINNSSPVNKSTWLSELLAGSNIDFSSIVDKVSQVKNLMDDVNNVYEQEKINVNDKSYTISRLDLFTNFKNQNKELYEALSKNVNNAGASHINNSNFALLITVLMTRSIVEEKGIEALQKLGLWTED